MKKLLLLITALLAGVSGAWAYSTTSVSSAQDSKGNALVSGAFYRILLPNRSASVALMQIDNEYVQAHNGLGVTKEYMWKVEEDPNGKALISNPSGGYWKFTDYAEGNSKLKTNGTSDNCTAFQMAWYSSSSKMLNLFDPAGGSYVYDGVTCGAVLSNHGGVGNYMGIYNNILDAGSVFKFERFYQTIFTISSEDDNGVAVENYPATVTINGSISASEYYTNSDNPITSFSTVYGAAYYIGGEEKTAEEVKEAINANTSTLNVTVKPKPFVASTDGSPAYYAIMISGNANSWFENTDGSVVDCASGNSIPSVTNRTAWIWEIKQNSTSGYRLFSTDANKYLGGRNATGGAFTLGEEASANTFRYLYNSGATVKFKDYTYDLWIDRSGGQPYAYTSGQQITFLRMYKVTFSNAIKVNDDEDVTTIYVKGDGSDVFTLPDDKLYSINGADAVGYSDAAAAIAACNSNLTVTVSNNTTKNVNYTLKWSDGSTITTVNDVTTNLLTPSSDYVPSSFVNDFTTLSYSPDEITNETTEVTVTATWNGPFQISSAYASAIWQVVQMHTYPGYPAEKWSWSYKNSDSDKVKPEQVLEYDDVTTNRLFCFVGNPYQGFKIYNAEKGSGYTLTRSGESAELTMASGEHYFTLHKSATNNNVTTYFTLKPSGAANYVNFDYTNKIITGWQDADNGSTCWVVAPGQYYLDFIDGLYLDAPAGAVGTRTYFQTVANVETAKSNIRACRSNVVSNMYSNELVSLNSYLNPVKETAVISLTDGGFYRIISAVPGFNNAAAWYYNPNVSTDHITWARAATTTEHQVNSLFKFTANSDKWNILSPNAQLSLTHDNTAFQAQTGTIGEVAGDITVSNITSSVQYTLQINVQTAHCNNHQSGNGTSGTLINYNANGVGEASAWYITKVNDVTIPLNVVDGKSYATMCLPFDVTLADGTDAYTVAISGERAALTKQNVTKIPAGAAVLLVNESGAGSVVATITSDAAALEGTNALTGTYVEKTSLAANEYIFGTKSDELGFWKLGENAKVGANKAYLVYDGAADVKGFSIDFSELTGINEIARSNTQEKAIFDLSGRRIQEPTRGLYIVNGKKVIVK